MSKEALQELVRDAGWEVLTDHIKKQRQRSMDALCGASSWDDVLRNQERVRAYDYVLKLPHELIRSEK